MISINNLVFLIAKLNGYVIDKKNLEEGCLSVRYLYGKVSRSHKATVEALDETGTKFTMGASGLLAQIFQHEIDHLDGTLFIDHLSRMKRDIILRKLKKTQRLAEPA